MVRAESGEQRLMAGKQLLILHGGDDPVTSPIASEEFVNNVKTIAQDATVNIVPVSVPEIHPRPLAEPHKFPGPLPRDSQRDGACAH